MKSEFAVFRDTWFASDEGKRCTNENTLPAVGYGRAEYLRNRLELAFLAGAAANEACKRKLGDELAAILDS